MNPFRQLNITGKIVLLVALLGALAAGITTYALTQLRAIEQEYRTVLDTDAQAAVLVGVALLDLADASRLVHAVLSKQDETDIRAVRPHLLQQQEDFRRRLATLRNLIPEAHAQLDEIGAQEAQLFLFATAVVDAAARWRGDRALDTIDNGFNPTLKTLRSNMEQVRTDVVGHFQQASQRLATTTETTLHRTILAVGLSLAGIIGLAVWWSLSRIARPINRLTEAMGHLTGRDYAHPIDYIERRDEIGKMAQALQVFRDTMQHADHLEIAKAQAEEMARAKSAFLATMSHEIRTPMNGVLGLLQLLQHTRLDARQQDYVDKATSAGQMLLGLLNAILDFSKIEADKLDLEQAPFQIDDLLHQLEIVLSAVAKAKPVTIRCQRDPAIPRVLLGDLLRLQQILLNLAGNAVKFTEQGEVTIRIDLEEISATTAKLAFRVRDTGIGIAPERLQVIFDAFTQGDDSTSRRFGGTGLGLSISQRLVQLMGGQITVESTPGQGSTFGFTLDFARNEATRAQEHEPARQESLATDKPLAGLRILVVEDNLLNQQVAHELLQHAGAEVTLADDGAAGIAAIKTAHPPLNVVLMDLQMPGMDGHQATRILRNDGLTLPIIAMTANTRPADQAACLAAGMNAHIGKPIVMAELIAAVRKHCLAPSSSAAPQGTATIPAAPGRRHDHPLPASPAGFDLPAAFARMDDDPSLYLMLARTFDENQRDAVAKARHALDQGDRQSARRHVHTLKGVAATLGAETLLRLAGAVEDAVLADVAAQELAGPLAALEQQLANDRARLQEIVAALEKITLP